MKVPDEIAIILTADRTPIAGLAVSLTFFMSQKNNYGFVFGPSDATGLVRVTGDQVRREAVKEASFFLMDYSAIDAYWAGTLRVTPVSIQSLARAQEAYQRFRHFEFAPGYEQMLAGAREVLGTISGAELDAIVSLRPDGPFRTEIEPIIVG